MHRPPVVDVDVHHTWKSDTDVLSYMPQRWRDLVLSPSGARSPLNPPAIWPPGQYGTNVRLDTFSPAGEAPGSDYETMRRQYLDPFNVRRAVLSFNIGLNGGLANPWLAAEVVRACNDWNRDYWLSIDDDRLASAILIPMQDPHEAAKEIRRVAGHPKIVEILLVANPLGRPFGHPIYHPIYEAAAEVGLPIAIHLGGEIGSPYQVAGGLPNSRLEMHALGPQAVVHHVCSFITQGVFEKFPSLHLLIIEAGVSWIPWSMWSLDATYNLLRQESPWVKRLPSEYFRQHVRVSTQPLEMSPKRDGLSKLLEAFEGLDDVLCYASDYPHWDTDEPAFVAGRVPRSWLPKVFHNNAAKMFGMPLLSNEEIMGPPRAARGEPQSLEAAK